MRFARMPAAPPFVLRTALNHDRLHAFLEGMPMAEGHQDAVVAERLGISVRTCRAHIARLSETLGAASRTQLGVRIAQAGLDGARPPVVIPPGRGSPTAR